MHVRPWQAAIWLFTIFIAPLCLAHPVPDIPVRTFFAGDGTAKVTVEVDPRCFDAHAAEAPYVLNGDLGVYPEKQKNDLLQKADELVKRSVEFNLIPYPLRPTFKYRFTTHGGLPLTKDEDPVMVLGELTTPLTAGVTGWQISATKEGRFSVIFQNIIRGETHPRIHTLFPGETSYTLDVTQLASSKAGESAPGSVSPKGSAMDRWHSFFSFLRQGFVHVLPDGLDHILFVLGLFLLSRAWRPLLAQVTTFTLAHSITLILATLGYVSASPAVVEPIIAASICFVALENIFRPKYTHWRLLVVFVFGLIHGLGFAGALKELDVPTSSLVVGLVGFNVGVEFGQLSVIAIAFLATAWVLNPPVYRRYVVIPGSAAIAAMGLWWTIERVIG